MSIFDQIEEIIKKKVKGKKDNMILSLEITGNAYYLDHLGQEDHGDYGECFETKKEMVDWLNENGWGIKVKHGS